MGRDDDAAADATGPFTREQAEALVAAIGKAERGNRGEVRLHLEDGCPGKALDRAREIFAGLKMHQTRDDTGVLLYVATGARKTAVFAGAGIHGQAEPDFWQAVADAVADGFRRDAPVEGLLTALERIGEILREHAPGDDEAGNELPNQVTTS
jgi:uncharacterized membrane protein